MESFWETLGDALVLLVKVVVAIAALRLALLVAGVEFYIPFIDPFLNTLLGHFKRAFGV